MIHRTFETGRRIGIRPRAAGAALAALLLLSACGDPAPEVVEPDTPASTTTEAPATSEDETTEPETTEPEATETGEESPTTSEEEATTSPEETSAAGQGQGLEPADSDIITDLALCGDDTYDTAENRCPETTADIATSALHCTADAQIEQAGPLGVRFYRDGALAFEVGADVPEEAVGSQVPLYADINVGQLELPQGEWACEMVLPGDVRETGETTVQGPAERFSQGSACNNSRVFEDGPVTHCIQDEGTLAATTPEIGCSGVVTDVLDKTIEIRAEWDTEETSGRRTLGSLDSPGGVLVVHGNMTSQALQDEAEFLPGDYRCVVLIDGEEIGAHDFQVG